MPSPLIRTILLQPAYDLTPKNCGVHGVDLVFLLHGDRGVIEFRICTNWYLDTLTKRAVNPPLPACVSYHAYHPQYPNQDSRSSCPLLNHAPCYCDSSSSAASELFNRLLSEGSDGVWSTLEGWYVNLLPIPTQPQK